MPPKTHVAASGSTNSEGLTTAPAQERFVSMCACTEPVGTGIGAMCVGRGRPKWPKTMLNHTRAHRHTYTVLAKKESYTFLRPVRKRLSVPWKTKKKNVRFARLIVLQQYGTQGMPVCLTYYYYYYYYNNYHYHYHYHYQYYHYYYYHL